MFKAIWNRMLREWKAGEQKPLLLWALMALGLLFWVPPLVCAMTGDSLTRNTESRAEGQKITPARDAAHVTRREIAACTSPEPPLAGKQVRMLLKTTILGENRRVALINDSLYSEGSVIQLDGESYLLSAVGPRQVELNNGGQVIVLEFPGRAAAEGWGLERVDLREREFEP